LGDILLEVFNAFANRFTFWIKAHDYPRITVKISSTTFFASPKSMSVFSL
jgi:hypothetical protein